METLNIVVALTVIATGWFAIYVVLRANLADNDDQQDGCGLNATRPVPQNRLKARFPVSEAPINGASDHAGA